MSLRKSLRKSTSRSSIFYLDSFEMKERSLFSFGSLEDAKCSSIPLIRFRSDEQVIPIKPIEGVIWFALGSGRCKGTVGQIVLTSKRLVFIPYRATSAESSTDSESHQRFPPFEMHALDPSGSSASDDSQRSNSVDFGNVFDISCKQNVLQLYLADFRCIEMQLKHSIWVKQLANQLERFVPRILSRYSTSLETSLNASSPLSAGNSLLSRGSSSWLASPSPLSASPARSSLHTTPITPTASASLISSFDESRTVTPLALLWQLLSRQFAYDYPATWSRTDCYWFEKNRSLRITQVNENKQICKTLPCTFVTLKPYLTDVNLQQNVSNRLKAQRVPVATFSTYGTYVSSPTADRFRTKLMPSKERVLLRSGMLDKDVAYAMVQAFSPIRILQTSDLMIDLNHLLHVYVKLRRICFPYANATRFFSHVGKWLKIVGKVLSVCHNLCKLICNESSLLLMEDEDNQWNIVISCLIQLILDPKKRTVAGFNALLAKEWVHLNGLAARAVTDRSTVIHHVLFVLFLDCVHQLRFQCPDHFEFTSLYLIRCFDLACDFSAEAQTLKQRLDSSNDESLLFSDLTIDQIMFFYNPRYDSTFATMQQLQISSDVLSLQFWRTFYLRWFLLRPPLAYYNNFGSAEYMYFNELIKSKYPAFDMKDATLLASQFEHCSIQDSQENSDSDCSYNQF